MRDLFQPLLFMVANCVEHQLIRQIEFLQAENRMLRKRVPKKRIFLSTDEKQKLIKLGQAIGPGLRSLITIVTYRTFQRWIQNKKNGKKSKKMGRPRTAEVIRELILRIARETTWGYNRILGELKKLRVSPISRSTVIKILKENGFDPGPKRGQGSWDEFLKMQAETLWQCDFFSKRIWTATGLRQYFVLVFLHIGTRRVFVSPACCKPDAGWMKTQAEAFLQRAKDISGQHAEFVVHDFDGMFVKDFDGALENSGIKIRKVGPRAPNLNAFVERWIQSIKHECLDNVIVFGEQHFNYLNSEYTSYYHTERPHQALGNDPLGEKPVGGPKPFENSDQIVCHERLGGLLKYYSRLAA